MRLPQLRLLRQEAGVDLAGLGDPALHVQHQGQVAQRVVVPWLMAERAPVAGFGLGQFAALLVDVAQVVVRVGVLRGGAQRQPYQPDAVLAAIALVAQHAEEMQGIGVPRLPLQDLAIERLGRIQPAIAMRGDCLAQQSLHGGGQRSMRPTSGSSGRSTFQAAPLLRAVASGTTRFPSPAACGKTGSDDPRHSS